MSFSGVKTAVRYFLESEAGRAASRADVAASFQAAVVDVLIDRLERAAALGPYRAAVLSGGVAANSALQAAFRAWSSRSGIPAIVPENAFCTDNAAMIAAAADRQGSALLADPRTLAANPNLPFGLGLAPAS
jgi:N6-L-threonylcarbamoyladenine synthase